MESNEIFSLLAGCVVGVLIGLFVLPKVVPGLTGDAPCGGASLETCREVVTCQENPRTATYEIVDGKECKRTRSIWGIDKTCTVTIKNADSQPATFAPIFSCFSIVNSKEPTEMRAVTRALSSGELGAFAIEYDSDGRDFICEIVRVDASTIQGCSLTTK
jgi:hypothetical protein